MAFRLQHPLPGATLTAHFGWRPAFTENGIWIPAMLHNGTDYGAPLGTLIRAAHAGRVTYVGWDNAGGGWMVKVSAAFGSTLYLHMRESSPLVRTGAEVRAGQGVGYVGMSGTATGAHLHFMLRLNGIDVNPLPYLTSTPKPPPPKPPPETEEPVMRGFYTKQGTTYKVIIFEPVSGFAHTYATKDVNLNERIADNWDTKSFVEGDQSHYDKLIEDLAEVRRGK